LNEAPILLSRSDVARLLTIEECITAVESAFRDYGRGLLPDPAVLGVHCPNGGFHIKTALDNHYFVAKLNSNFPGNPANHSLPTIQGLIALFDASNGRPLAILDSVEITVQRTAAATAVAAKYLARAESATLAICGCGIQAAAQLAAVRAVLPIRRVLAFDIDRTKAEAFVSGHDRSRAATGETTSGSGRCSIEVAPGIQEALADADVCVTCTPSRKAFLTPEMVRAGTFIAAVGADNPEKQEIDPRLLKKSKVVADILDQCATIGDLHHAIVAGVMTKADVHAELGAVVAGKAPGRESDDEIIIFDSTGTALQDAAAVCAVYSKVLARGGVSRFDFAG
jgi:alanine dehydrogenase